MHANNIELSPKIDRRVFRTFDNRRGSRSIAVRLRFWWQGKLIHRLAAQGKTVVIIGATGTGKTWLLRKAVGGNVISFFLDALAEPYPFQHVLTAEEIPSAPFAVDEPQLIEPQSLITMAKRMTQEGRGWIIATQSLDNVRDIVDLRDPNVVQIHLESRADSSENMIDFSAQLGDTIDIFSTAPSEIKQIAAGFSAYLAGETDKGYALLTNADRSNVSEFCHTPSGKHAYIYTELLGLALLAREQISFPAKNKLEWLTKHDPVLYDLLTNLNMPVQPLSCAGIVAHFMAEQYAGHAIETPMVQAAQQAFRLSRK